ncbi:hypothetical protein GQ42DRAFT_161353 [Ramicandelaber brevisporus]|nr:hypothetical protein GQ42DRAFT_161353 [Ramicandelaber brevisporus]
MATADWQDKAFSQIFDLTLDPRIPNRASRLALTRVADELRGESGNDAAFKPYITTDVLDRVLLVRLTLDIYAPGVQPDLSDPQVASAIALKNSSPSHHLNGAAFEYLLACWTRATTVRRNLVGMSSPTARSPQQQSRQQQQTPPSPEAINARVAALDQAIELIVNYAGSVLLNPEEFQQPFGRKYVSRLAALTALGRSVEYGGPGPEQLVERLRVTNDSLPSGISNEFLDALFKSLSDEDLEHLIKPILSRLSDDLLQMNIMGDFLPILDILQRLVNFPVVAAAIARHPDFVPPENTQPNFLEFKALLGPFFRMSAFYDEALDILRAHFTDCESRMQSDLIAARQAIGGIIKTMHDRQFQIMDTIVRNGEAARKRVLQLFALMANKNEKRNATYTRGFSLSTRGFLSNLAAVAIRFCEPIMDTSFSRLRLIDPDYLRFSTILNVREETKLSADQAESDSYYGKSMPTSNQPGRPEPKFVTEIFFIALALHRRGNISAFAQFKEIERAYQRASDEAADAIVQTADAATQAAHRQRQANKSKLKDMQQAMHAVLFNQDELRLQMRLSALTIAWVLRIIDPTHRFPAVPLPVSPLPTEFPPTLSLQPEYILDDVVTMYRNMLHYDLVLFLEDWDMLRVDDFIALSLVLLNRGEQSVRNPYLKQGLVEVIFLLDFHFSPKMDDEEFDPHNFANPRNNPRRYGRASDSFEAMLNLNHLVIEHLVPVLMDFYAAVEQTGTHSQFYEKFETRYRITRVFRSIWNNPAHRQRFRDMTEHRAEFFVRYANLLMNDTTFLLDETMNCLGTINGIEREKADANHWASLTDREREEKDALMAQSEVRVKSDIELSCETLHQLCMLTEATPEPFLREEIVDRLAAMLDSNLASMAGPRMSNLRVSDPEKYKWRPRKFLSDILTIYINLARFPIFVQAVARDERSFNSSLFRRACTIASNYALKTHGELSIIANFLQTVEQNRADTAREEELLGEDIPEEFLDPVMYTLMRDPVLLPTSNQTVDMATIKSHLLSDEKDPFNRMPLTIDMVQPNVELKQKIEAWIAERRSQRS